MNHFKNVSVYKNNIFLHLNFQQKMQESSKLNNNKLKPIFLKEQMSSFWPVLIDAKQLPESGNRV